MSQVGVQSKCAMKEVDIFFSAIQSPLQQEVLPWRKQVSPEGVVYHSTGKTEGESEFLLPLQLWGCGSLKHILEKLEERNKERINIYTAQVKPPTGYLWHIVPSLRLLPRYSDPYSDMKSFFATSAADVTYESSKTKSRCHFPEFSCIYISRTEMEWACKESIAHSILSTKYSWIW